MNERIQELAEQIGFPMGYDNPAWAYEEDIYKFAELIVKECATKMALEIMNNSWIDDAVKNTYRHFGVEE